MSSEIAQGAVACGPHLRPQPEAIRAIMLDGQSIFALHGLHGLWARTCCRTLRSGWCSTKPGRPAWPRTFGTDRGG